MNQPSAENVERAKDWLLDYINDIPKHMDRDLAQALDEAEQRARVDMLRMIQGSLEGYPNLGGDIGIMIAVEKIEKEAERRGAVKELRRMEGRCSHDDFVLAADHCFRVWLRDRANELEAKTPQREGE